MGCGFTSKGQESWSAFDTSVCKIQTRKHLPSMLKDKAASSLVVNDPLDVALALRK